MTLPGWGRKVLLLAIIPVPPDAKKEKKVPVAQDELASTHTLDPSPIDTAPNQYYVLEEVHNVTPLLWAINLPLLP